MLGGTGERNQFNCFLSMFITSLRRNGWKDPNINNFQIEWLFICTVTKIWTFCTQHPAVRVKSTIRILSLPRMSMSKFFLSSPALLDTIQVYLPASSTAACIRRRLRPPGHQTLNIICLLWSWNAFKKTTLTKSRPLVHKRKTSPGCVNNSLKLLKVNHPSVKTGVS